MTSSCGFPLYTSVSQVVIDSYSRRWHENEKGGWHLPNQVFFNQVM